MTNNKELSDPTTKQARRRKVAAVLAGGLVLGVGTMATLASWNDSEFAKATFTAGTFDMVGAVDGAQSVFSQHTSAGGAATLGFTSTFGNMQPGDTVYAPYALQLTKDTNYNGTVVISPGTMVGSTAGLSYTLFTTAVAGCSGSSTVGSTIVVAGTPLNSVSATPATITLNKTTSLGTNPGAPVYLCFKVTADTNLVQAQTAAPVWNFTATSGAS